jgi:hypothetical protein
MLRTKRADSLRTFGWRSPEDEEMHRMLEGIADEGELLSLVWRSGRGRGPDRRG